MRGEFKGPILKSVLNKDAKSDLIVWLSFLEQYNGRTFFLDERMSAPRYEITSDVASSKMCLFLFSLNILSRSRKQSLKFSSCHPNKEYCCFQSEISGFLLLRGSPFRSSLLPHGNETESVRLIETCQIVPN